ncbi:hypothetical protein V1477_005558 [Vespula maculifrons]|uniref:Uncharacterized protein n=2 Tax=Vespula TaxID=7451 RepID=A0A834KNG4_VESVU|nr:hypothetical protein HZH66_001773 [Vespula vulgaris]
MPSFRNAGSDMHLRACQGQSRPGLLILNSATFATTTAVLLSIEPCRTYHEFRGLNLLWVERTLLNSGTSNPGVKGLFPDPDGYFISRECYESVSKTLRELAVKIFGFAVIGGYIMWSVERAVRSLNAVIPQTGAPL